MFDVLLREMATRFGLGEKARDVLAALLALIFDPASGGFDGFVRRLRAGGLDAQVDAWLGRGENKPVSAAAVETALGAPLVAALAQRAGLAPAKMASTLTALLPSVLDKLSPDGVRPVAGVVPAAVAPLLAGQAGFVAASRDLWPVMADAPAAVVAHKPAVVATAHAPTQHAAAAHVHAAADHHGDTHGPSHDGAMGGRWIVWATLAGILAAGGWWFASIRNTEPTPPATLTLQPASSIDTTREPVKATEAALTLAVGADTVRMSGVVDSLGAAQQLEGAARNVFGERLQLQLDTDPMLSGTPWLQPLLAALPSLDQPGLELQFNDQLVELQQLPTAADEATALARLAPAFADLRQVGLFDPAVRAFAALPQDGLEGASLVAALNLMHVYFESGAHTIRADSRRVLRRAAEVIQRAPEGTVIEIGGHTDDRGEVQANRDLSEQRAFAVQEALISAGVSYSRLTARGYGADQPVADNGSREGRAQNRRIQFTLLR